MSKLYNPTLDDVVTYFDKLGPNPQKFTLKAGEIQEFPDKIGELIKQKLIDKIYWENPPKKGRAKRIQEIKDLIEVK